MTKGHVEKVKAALQKAQDEYEDYCMQSFAVIPKNDVRCKRELLGLILLLPDFEENCIHFICRESYLFEKLNEVGFFAQTFQPKEWVHFS